MFANDLKLLNSLQVESSSMHEKALDIGEQMDDQDSDLEDTGESDGEKENAENILPDKVGIVQESRKKKKNEDGEEEAVEDDPLFKLEGKQLLGLGIRYNSVCSYVTVFVYLHVIKSGHLVSEIQILN